MRITGEADYFVKQYGIDTGLQKLQQAGYQRISYSIREMHEDATFGTWSKEQMEEHYRTLKEALEKYQLQLSYITMDRGIYGATQDVGIDKRRTWCVQAMRVAAYLGAPAVVIRPADVPLESADSYAYSKDILTQAVAAMTEEGKKLGVLVAIENIYRYHVYGNRVEELLELVNHYGVKILLNPSSAHTMREPIPCFVNRGFWTGPRRAYPEGIRSSGTIEAVREHLIGIVLNDIEHTMANPIFPLYGEIDYREIRRQLGNFAENICLTVDYKKIYRRYEDFAHEESLMDVLGEYFYKLAASIGAKEGL